jgi:hypothetical protein
MQRRRKGTSSFLAESRAFSLCGADSLMRPDHWRRKEIRNRRSPSRFFFAQWAARSVEYGALNGGSVVSGTSGSNLLSSSGESAANLIFRLPVAPSECPIRCRCGDNEKDAREKCTLRGSPDGHHALSATGSIKLGSLFFTLPTRVLTGQQVISSEGWGASKAFKRGRSVVRT